MGMKRLTKKIIGIMLSCIMIMAMACVPSFDARAAAMGVTYRTHVQSYGWQKWKSNGQMSGTSGEAKRLEGIEIKLTGSQYDGSIEYRTHVQTYGWQAWKKNGQMSGTSGEAKRLEGIEISLTGTVSQYYDIYYRVHVQTYGWQAWKKNGEMAGTSGQGKRLEGIEIKLVKKENISKKSNTVSYRTHVQSYGWQEWKNNGEPAGTSGQGKRLEGINISLDGSQYSGGIKYRTHVQTYGWQAWKMNGAMSGTSGEAKRLEAIEIELYGEIAKYYDVYYRVHVQTYGWQPWKKNGQVAGTLGEGKRLESIQIKLYKKGTKPTNTSAPKWHPPKTKQVWVVDEPEWTEEYPVYEYVLAMRCHGCGEYFYSSESFKKHIKADGYDDCRGGFTDEYVEKFVKMETYVHPEKGHYETVVEQEGYWE